MAIPIIGEISALGSQREQYRGFMREAKTQKEYAEWKRKFRKARNGVLALKERMRDA